MNLLAPWPKDPAETAKLGERMWAAMDDLMKKGIIKEFGYFLNGTSGYTIGEGDIAEAFKDVSMFLPYYEQEVHEVIPYEKGKEILRAVAKAQAEAAKK
jgi:hypothetical protein